MALRFDEIQLFNSGSDVYPVLSSGTGNGLKIQSATGYGDFGSGNTSYFHISTDRGTFYFSKPITVNGNVTGYNTTNTVTFDKFIDASDTSFFVDPHSYSLVSRFLIGAETSSSNTGMYDSHIDSGSSYFQYPKAIIVHEDSSTGGIDEADVGLFILNKHGANNTWAKLSLGAREATGSGNSVSIGGLAVQKTTGTANAWAAGDLYLWTKKNAIQIINQKSSQDGNTDIYGNLYGKQNKNTPGIPVIDGFVAGEGVENGEAHFTIPSLSSNRLAGANWRYTVAADIDGTAFTLNSAVFSVGNDYHSIGSLTAGSTSSSVMTIVISGVSFSHASSVGIAFSAANWRAKDVEIFTSTDGTNYTSRVNNENNPRGTTYVTFSTGGTATTHIKFVLKNFNTTSTRIANIFAGNYSGGDTRVIDKYQPDTKFKSLRIDSSGETDNEYLVLQESGAQRFRIYENSNNVYFDGGPGNTHFRPRQGGGSGGVMITGGPLYVPKIYDNDDTQFYLDPSVYSSTRNSYLWEKSSSTINIKSYGENHLKIGRSGSGYVFALMGDDINENANNHGQNWEVSFDFNAASGNDSTHFGWVFNYQDSNDFYAVVIRDANTVRVQKQVDGVQTYPVAAVTTTNVAGGTIDIDDSWHNCRIQKSKNYIIVEIDGVTQIATTIEASLTYDFGRMGFTVYDNSVEFKNFSLRRGALQQLILGSGVDPGSSWNGIYDDDNLVLTDGSLTINPHRRGDYGENAASATSTSFNSRLNIWSENEDHITFGGANTHMVSAWEQWKMWINNDSGSNGMLRLYHKNTKVEFGRFDGGGSSFLLGNLTTTLIGNVTGNVSGSSGSCTGNAATATTATNADTVDNVHVDGLFQIQANPGLHGTNTYAMSSNLYPEPAANYFGHNGNNTGLNACVLRHKIVDSYGYTSSWADVSSETNFNNLLGSNMAHQWGNCNLKRAKSDYIIYFGNQTGYCFIGYLLMTHSTHGNSFNIKIETTGTNPDASGVSIANRTANVGSGGWTLKYETGNQSSWPGYSTHKVYCQIGGSADDFMRVRLTPTWNSGNTHEISLGIISMLASYGTVIQSLKFDNLADAQFHGGANFRNGKKLTLGSGGHTDIHHTGTHAYITNKTGGLFIGNDQQDGNLVFQCDNGAGSLYDYFYLDGGSATYASSATTAVYTKWGNKSHIHLQEHDSSIIKEAGGSNGNYPAIELYSSGTADTGAAIAIQQQTSEGDTIIFADYEPHVEWGISAENGSNLLHFTAGSSTGNSDLGNKTFYNNAGTARTAYNKMQFNLTDGKMAIGGALAIGHLTPAQALHVLSTGTQARFQSTSSYSDIMFTNSSGTGGFLNFGSTTSFNVYVGGGSASNLEMSLTNTGTLTVSGDVIAFGSPSDIRLKENIKPINSALDKVMKLQGVTFDWKEKQDAVDREGNPVELQKWKSDVGFIAQDVQKVIPELVRENEDGMLSMRHQGVVPILLEAIKELKQEITELKKQIK
jgi:hypothetical protein